MWQVIVGASLSIVLYLFLTIVSFLHWYPLYVQGKIVGSSFDENYLDPTHAIFNKGRRIFFFLLMVCSILDQPYFIACLAMGGPPGCTWGTSSFTVVWILHLIALVGYFICIGTPLKLWADIINNKTGDVFSCRGYTSSKTLIHLSMVLYFCIVFAEAIVLLMVGPSQDHDSRKLQFMRGLEALFYALVALFWFLQGVRLTYFVKRYMSKNGQEKRLLCNASIVMSIILVSYLFRTALIMGAGLGRYLGYQKIDVLKEHYVFWVAGTRWLPYIVCSCLLIYVLRLSEKSRTPGGSGYSGYTSIMKSVMEDDSEDHSADDGKEDSRIIFGGAGSDGHGGFEKELYGSWKMSDEVYIDDPGSGIASFWLNNIWSTQANPVEPNTN